MDKSCCDIKLEMSYSLRFYEKFFESYGVNKNALAIIVAAIVVVLSTVVWKLVRGKARKKNSIILVGASDSGKTTLFGQLVAGSNVGTQTSLKENEAVYQATGGKGEKLFRLLDLPGHQSIRRHFLDKFKDSARGILFVIDSVSFSKNHQDVAEFLFQLLTNKSVWGASPSICIACNKQDQLLAKSKKVIQSHLEKELNTVRKTQSAALTSTSGVGDSQIFLGSKESDFEFDQLGKYKIAFVESSAKPTPNADVNLDEVTSWISSLI